MFSTYENYASNNHVPLDSKMDQHFIPENRTVKWKKSKKETEFVELLLGVNKDNVKIY